MISLPKREYATLPSVSGWSSDMGIQKDPPREGWTRVKTYATEANMMTGMVADSGDRFSEAIQLFPRGRNPMVSVQYNNYDGKVQASNPHKIMEGGAFRPPLLTARDLLPLSRQPRLPTQMQNNQEDVRSEMLGVNQDQVVGNPVFINLDTRTVTPVDAPISFPAVEFPPIIRYLEQDIRESPLRANVPQITVPNVEFQVDVNYSNRLQKASMVARVQTFDNDFITDKQEQNRSQVGELTSKVYGSAQLGKTHNVTLVPTNDDGNMSIRTRDTTTTSHQTLPSRADYTNRDADIKQYGSIMRVRSMNPVSIQTNESFNQGTLNYNPVSSNMNGIRKQKDILRTDAGSLTHSDRVIDTLIQPTNIPASIKDSNSKIKSDFMSDRL